MATTTAALTPAMRQALRRRPLRLAARNAALGLLGWAALSIILVVYARSDGGEFSVEVALFVSLMLLAAFAVIGLIAMAVLSILMVRGLRAGTYTRYSGPIGVRTEQRRNQHGRYEWRVLWLGGSEFRVDERACVKDGPTLESFSAGTAVFSAPADMLFAVWDESGACAYREPSYTPDQAGEPAPALNGATTGPR